MSWSWSDRAKAKSLGNCGAFMSHPGVVCTKKFAVTDRNEALALENSICRGSKTLSAPNFDATVGIRSFRGNKEAWARLIVSFHVNTFNRARAVRSKANIFGKRAAFIPNQRRG